MARKFKKHAVNGAMMLAFLTSVMSFLERTMDFVEGMWDRMFATQDHPASSTEAPVTETGADALVERDYVRESAPHADAMPLEGYSDEDLFPASYVPKALSEPFMYPSTISTVTAFALFLVLLWVRILLRGDGKDDTVSK